MNNSELLDYKGYYGSMSVSHEDECLHGRIEFIADLVTYEGETVPELKDAFKAAVDDYLATCEEVGKEPLKSCSGTFNVRIGPELHKASLIAAKQTDTSLNDFVKQAVSDKVAQRIVPAQLHLHTHIETTKTTSYRPEDSDSSIRWRVSNFHTTQTPRRSRFARNG